MTEKAGEISMDTTSINEEIEAMDLDEATKALMKEHAFLTKQAEQAFDEERYEDEISILEMILERTPHDLNAKTMLACAYVSSGYPVKSIRLWEELCEEEPDVGIYSLFLALGYRRQEWTKKALKQFKTTVELMPYNQMAWEFLVECSVETEDEYEAKMNCFGAMYLLREHGIESVKLNAVAFSLMVLNDNDMADRHLSTIIDLMRNGEEEKQDLYENVIRSVLHEIDLAESYEFLPRIREMTDCLSEISDELAEEISGVEMGSEVEAMEKTFPEALCSIIDLINEDCGCDECMRNITSLECSILADFEGYHPELVRLSIEHPILYALHAEFFDETASASDSDRNKQLTKRFRVLSDSGVEPILTRADGSRVNPVVETYRREGPKVGRNEMCPCGSGKKYKKCCGA